MDMSTATQLITSVGFPIFSCLALGYFIYKVYTEMSKKEDTREEKLYSIISASQAQIDASIKTNSDFVTELKTMQQSVQDISADVDDIKDYLKISDKTEA